MHLREGGPTPYIGDSHPTLSDGNPFIRHVKPYRIGFISLSATTGNQWELIDLTFTPLKFKIDTVEEKRNRLKSGKFGRLLNNVLLICRYCSTYFAPGIPKIYYLFPNHHFWKDPYKPIRAQPTGCSLVLVPVGVPSKGRSKRHQQKLPEGRNRENADTFAEQCMFK